MAGGVDGWLAVGRGGGRLRDGWVGVKGRIGKEEDVDLDKVIIKKDGYSLVCFSSKEG